MKPEKEMVFLVGGALIAVALAVAFLAFHDNGKNTLSYFRGGCTTQTARMWMAALLAAACGSAVVYVSMKH